MPFRIFRPFLILFPVFFVLFPQAVSAAAIDIWEGTGPPGQTCNIREGGCSFCDALTVTSNIIQYLWDLAIALSVLMIVYGALRLMIAGGSEEQIKKGKNIITNAVIGLVIALAAWAIINTILHILAGSVDFPWNQIRCS